MAKIEVGASVNIDIPLWRYMSLDKLIDLLESNSLFFTSLDSYQKSDPFEGYLPKVAFEAYSNIFGAEIRELEEAKDQLKVRIGKSTPALDELLKIENTIEAMREKVKKAYKEIIQSVTVNCWHANNSESEAMWKLYSDNGKGIAVKTNVASLVKSIEHFQQDVSVRMGAVKYLDFNDDNILPKDCVTDGHLSPLLKRSSFSHENEVRLFSMYKFNDSNLNYFQPKSQLIKAFAMDLIEEIYISPFAGEPFISSVRAICSKYSLPDEIVNESKLLDGHEELLDNMVKW